MNQTIGLKDLKFISNDYIIYKNGKDITGHCYGYLREIRIRRNRKVLALYDVTIYKLQENRAIRTKLLPTTQLLLVAQDHLHIQLQNPDYRLILGLHNNSVQQVTLTRYGNNTDTVFRKALTKKMEQQINIPLSAHLRNMNVLAKNGLIEKYNRVVNEMQEKGQAAAAIAQYYLFLGKLQFQQGLYREAKEAFTQSIMVLIFNAERPGHEAYYWFGKVNEAEGNTIEAKTFYRLALERYTGNAEFVSREEIIEALNR